MVLKMGVKRGLGKRGFQGGQAMASGSTMEVSCWCGDGNSRRRNKGDEMFE